MSKMLFLGLLLQWFCERYLIRPIFAPVQSYVQFSILKFAPIIGTLLIVIIKLFRIKDGDVGNVQNSNIYTIILDICLRMEKLLTGEPKCFGP